MKKPGKIYLVGAITAWQTAGVLYYADNMDFTMLSQRSRKF